MLLDPYSPAVVYGEHYSRGAAVGFGDRAASQSMKSVVMDQRGYDWEGDTPLGRPLGETVIYELHVGGFTRNPNSGLLPEKR